MVHTDGQLRPRGGNDLLKVTGQTRSPHLPGRLQLPRSFVQTLKGKSCPQEVPLPGVGRTEKEVEAKGTSPSLPYL